MKRTLLVLTAMLVVLTAASAGSATAVAPGPTLTLTPSTVAGGGSFTATGCGYDPSFGDVEVNLYAGAGGYFTYSPIDSNGCISANLVAEDGSGTLPSGTYTVVAQQLLHRLWKTRAKATLIVT